MTIKKGIYFSFAAVFVVMLQIAANDSSTTLQIVTREEWLAQPPAADLTNLELPVSTIIIGHTATASCDTKDVCSLRVRLIQLFHMESRHWDDIAGNFLIGGDGNVYEGRGWNKQGAHTKGHNRDSIGVTLIGTFVTVAPVQKQLDALKFLLEEGVRLNKIKTDYKLSPQRKFSQTVSPGDKVIEILENWPHYAGPEEE